MVSPPWVHHWSVAPLRPSRGHSNFTPKVIKNIMDMIARGVATVVDQELFDEYKAVHVREGSSQGNDADRWEVESVDSDVEIIC